jgi:Fe-S-cluster containining protein
MDGLRFECQPGCTNCCRTHGFVYITPEDLVRIAAHLGMTPELFEAKYVFRTKHLLRLRKPREKQCHFLTDRGCTVHAAKPVQCRAYPFWPEFVQYRDLWEEEGKKCPGINQGPLVQIGTALELAAEMEASYRGIYGTSSLLTPSTDAA